MCARACAPSVIISNEVNINWLPVSLNSSHLKSNIAVDINSHNTYRAPYMTALICFQMPPAEREEDWCLQVYCEVG